MLDIWLPGMDGLATLARLRERRVDAPVVMISGHGNIESAVRAIKLGAFDFIEKPLSLEKTVLVVGNAVRQRRLEAENRALRAHVDRRLTMVGESYVMAQLREQVAMAAPTNGRVLIYGENGTGKELVARSDPRAQPPARRAVRRGELRRDSRGADRERAVRAREGRVHRRGADRRGKFELADGGTLFLDEIGDMSLKTQAKVLRALQEQVVEPVGGTASVRVDVRVLAATNKDLPTEIRAGAFPRGPLLPAERHPDLRAAAARSRRRHPAAGRALHGGVRARVRPAAEDVRRRGAMSVLQRYRWPGNVRELRNVHRAADDHGAGRHDRAGGPGVPRRAARASTSRPERRPMPLHDARDAFERDYILRALAAQHGNISRTADVLGVERSNLYRKMRGFGIAPVSA